MDSELIQLVNRLQASCTQLGDYGALDNDDFSLFDSLPQIAVVGGQSAGKSSVLEAVVGRDFLPRSAGICTRRPLVVSLQKTAEGSNEEGEFGHKKNVVMKFPQIREEIEAETERSTSGKNVSKTPIYLTIRSPHVVDLTLVDLPGLTRVPVEGQSESVPQDIEDMVKEYVSKPNCIMLVVHPANQDLANSDGLRLSRSVDPGMERSMLVLTKIDLMDKGTDASEIFEGHTYQTRFPAIGVVNRSQADIKSDVPMIEARKKEMEFFRNHPSYSHLVNRMGTAHLAKEVSTLLVDMIREKIPHINSSISRNIQKLNMELRDMGGSIPDKKEDMMCMLLELCRVFGEHYHKQIEEEGGGEALYATFKTKLSAKIDSLPFENLLEIKNVARIIQEADGYQPHLIAPENGYKRLTQAALKMLHEPVETAVIDVYTLMCDFLGGAASIQKLERFGRLRNELIAIATERLSELKEETREMGDTLVSMENSHFDAEFFRNLSTGPDLEGAKGDSGLPIETEGYLRRISSNVAAYVDSICQNLKKTIPKLIVHCLIENAKKTMLNKFQAQIMAKDTRGLLSLLSESEEMMKRRKQIAEKLELLNLAQKEIDSVV